MKRGLAILAAGVCCLAAQAPVTRPFNPPASTGKASVQGKVVDALTHEPVRKATVTLSGRQVNLSASTDADGHFAFRQLPAGSYTIVAQSQKYPVSPNSYEPARQAAVALTGDEEKSGVELALTPGGSVGGHVVDEEGYPMPHCQIAVTQFYDDGARGGTTFTVGGGRSDDKGEYRTEGVAAGKYYLVARCPATVPLPHALLPRDDAKNAPALFYPARFYPGAADPSGAAKVTVSPGSALTGIDIQMAPSAGFAVSGHLHPASKERLMLELRPKDPQLARWRQVQTAVEPNVTEFRFSNVPAGSYEVVAGGAGEDCACFATGALEIGDKPPDPIDVALSPAPRISGTITAIRGDSKTPITNVRVSLLPLDASFGPVPQARVSGDGTFTLTAVPGRWRLQVAGMPGYIKSATMGDQDVSPDSLQTGAAPTTLRITYDTKPIQISGTVSNYPSDGSGVFAVLWSASGTPDRNQVLQVNPPGGINNIVVPPGHYYLCATTASPPLMILRSPPLRKALEPSCASVEASADTQAAVSIPLISADEVKRLQDNLE